MSELRTHARTPAAMRLKIRHDRLGEQVVNTRDISDGGVFAVIDNPDIAVGEQLQAQVMGIVAAPELTLEVVRVAEDGIGLRFVK